MRAKRQDEAQEMPNWVWCWVGEQHRCRWQGVYDPLSPRPVQTGGGEIWAASSPSSQGGRPELGLARLTSTTGCPQSRLCSQGPGAKLRPLQP